VAWGILAELAGSTEEIILLERNPPEEATMPDTSEVPQEAAPLDIRRHENYENWYSNNVQFQQTEWDLKLIFGQLDWSDDHFVIEQHTAITVAWIQAKMLLYYLNFQVGAYEMSHGKIPIPAGAMPPEPHPPTGEQAKDQFSNRLYEYMKKAREQLLAEQSG
jgi:hypothetical protein